MLKWSMNDKMSKRGSDLKDSCCDHPLQQPAETELFTGHWFFYPIMKSLLFSTSRKAVSGNLSIAPQYVGLGL